MNQMKNLTVTSASLPTDTNITSSMAPRPVSTISFSNEYEITETSVQSTKKSAAIVATFPPHPFSTVGAENIDPNAVISQNGCSSSKTNVINQDDHYVCHERNLATPTSLCEGTIQFGNTSKLYGMSSMSTM